MVVDKFVLSTVQNVSFHAPFLTLLPRPNCMISSGDGHCDNAAKAAPGAGACQTMDEPRGRLLRPLDNSVDTMGPIGYVGVARWTVKDMSH